MSPDDEAPPQPVGDEDFAALLAASLEPAVFETGQTVQGVVVLIGRDVVFVDVGGKGEATMDLAELQDEDGQIQLTHSVSAGLDYAAVGPEHAWLRDQSCAEYTYAPDEKALEAFFKLSKLEGIIPALESSHAIAEVIARAPQMSSDQIIICNLSGRGDKDVQQVAEKVNL